jgi:hypothetical protein
MLIGRPKHEMQERIRYIRRDFARQYPHKRRENLRLELCEEQNDLCILCSKRLQDRSSIITEIEHTIPVYIFAESSMPIEEAARFANDRSNLAAAHVACQRSKGALDVFEWSEQVDAGSFNLKMPKLLSRREIESMLEKRKAFITPEQRRINGQKGIAVLLAKLTPEQIKSNAIKAGTASRAKRLNKFTPREKAEYLAYLSEGNPSVNNVRAWLSLNEEQRKNFLVYVAEGHQPPHNMQQWIASQKLTPEQKRARRHEIVVKAGTASQASRTPEQRIKEAQASSERTRLQMSRLTPEQRKALVANARKAGLAFQAKLTPEERRANMKLVRSYQRGSEKKKASDRKNIKKATHRRWHPPGPFESCRLCNRQQKSLDR